MTDKMRVGIIGAGEIANYHIHMLKEIKTVELGGLCDVEKSRAKLTASRHAVKNFYADHSEMIAEEKPDVVHVLTPPEFSRMVYSCLYVLIEWSSD